jgi:phage terminase large subunit-like protein
VLNARNRKGPSGMWIAKEHPDSSNKIDAAWALVAAYAARIDALAAGMGEIREPAVPRRIR